MVTVIKVVSPVVNFNWWSHIEGGWGQEEKRLGMASAKKVVKTNKELGTLLKHIKLDHLEASTDIIKDRDFASIDPVYLPISALCYVNYATKEQHEVLRRCIPHFDCFTEGKPQYAYRNWRKPLQPAFCEWRNNYLYERRTLEELFSLVGVKGDETRGVNKYLVTPPWYIAGKENVIVAFPYEYHPDSDLFSLPAHKVVEINSTLKRLGYGPIQPASKDTRVVGETSADEEQKTLIERISKFYRPDSPVIPRG
jgi:hypothetical protein